MTEVRIVLLVSLFLHKTKYIVTTNCADSLKIKENVNVLQYFFF